MTSLKRAVVVLSMLVLGAPAAQSQCVSPFYDGMVVPGARGGSDLCVADLDCDGNGDFIYLSWTEYGFECLVVGINDGTEHFDRTTLTLYAEEPYDRADMTSINLDGDAYLDVIGVTWGAEWDDHAYLTAYLNTGNGSFGSAVVTSTIPIATFNGPRIASGDIDGDGFSDVAVYSHPASNVSFHLGNGNGSFAPAFSISLSENPNALGLIDVTEDGNADLIVTDQNGLLIYRSNGDGSFQTPEVYPGQMNGSIRSGDLDGDGDTDLVVTNGSQWWVLTNDGTGSFTSSASYPAWSGSIPELGDLDEDGDVDVVVGPEVFLNNGDGSYADPFEHGVSHLGSVRLRDVNGDGHLDLCIGGVPVGVRIIYGNGDASFNVPQRYEAVGGPRALVHADFNGDGLEDLAVARGGSDDIPNDKVSILLGHAAGGFIEFGEYTVDPGCAGLDAGDLDHDGDKDLAVANAGTATAPGDTVSILINNGDGSFQPPVMYQVGSRVTDVAIAHLNLDLAPDLVTAGEPCYVLRGVGDGTFTIHSALTINGRSLELGDLDGDGDVDIVALAGPVDWQSMNVLMNNGCGTFVDPVTYTLYPNGYYDVWDKIGRDIELGDTDADGDLDVVVTAEYEVSPGFDYYYASYVHVFQNAGDGSLSEAQWFNIRRASEPGIRCIAFADIDGDTYDDLVFSSFRHHGVDVILNRQDGTFVREDLRYFAGLGTRDVAAADFDRDGDIDIATAESGSDEVGVFLFECVEECPGDITGDGVVDQNDLGFLLACYGHSDGGDLDGDGDTDQADLGILLADYGCGVQS